VNKETKKKLAIFGIGAGISLFFMLFYITGVLDEYEYKTLDLRFKIRGPRQAPKNLHIIAMGDESVNDRAFGRWPWNRKIHAIFLNILSKYSPKSVMYDVLFTENSDPIEDNALASQIGKLNVYFPFFCIIDKGKPKDITNPFQKLLLKRVKLPSVKGPVLNAIEIVPPIAKFAVQVKGSGYANAIPDSDGKTRRVPLLIKYKEGFYPHIALKIALDWLGASKDDIKIKAGKYLKIKTKDRVIKIPLDKNNQMLLNFCGPLDMYNPMSFLGVVNLYSDNPDDKRLRALKDSAVFIGLTATGTVDLRPTPFSSLFPLVGVVATTFENIVNENFLIPSSCFFDIFMILIIGILITYLSSITGPQKGAIYTFLIFIFWCVISYFLFLKARFVVPVFYPTTCGVFTFLGITIYRFATEEKEKKFIKNMFQRYVSSQVVDELIKNPDMLKLGGQRKYLSVFFSDIRGFTSMSEKMEPEEVVQLLNEYLTEMTKIIFQFQGTLDKFIGDAVMAFWGAPKYFPNHAELAVRAAVEMQKKVTELCEKWAIEGRKKIGIGMGVNTGDVVIGNMGSQNFADYTVIGDNVNLAARLEENAKAGQILISQSTYDEIKDIVKVTKLEPLRVKGKEKAVQVYEVLEIL